jgi:hypothetical protein
MQKHLYMYLPYFKVSIALKVMTDGRQKDSPKAQTNIQSSSASMSTPLVSHRLRPSPTLVSGDSCLSLNDGCKAAFEVLRSLQYKGHVKTLRCHTAGANAQ